MKKRGYPNKVLITGSNGFIGTNLKKELDQFEFWDLSLGRDIFEWNFERAVERSDTVVHLAALTSVAKSFKDPDETFRVNVLGTARVAQLCMKYNRKLIFPSSASVLHPDLSPYAKSKKMAEDIVKEVPNSVILRFYNVFGPNMNPDSGSIMYNFLTSKKLVVYGDGEQTRDYIHVRDVVAIIQDAFKKKWNGKIVDVGTGQSYSTNYVAGLFAHYRGLKIKYEPPRREIRWSIADTTMLKQLYKKPLTTNLEKDISALCRN